jgi:hypothetical protein
MTRRRSVAVGKAHTALAAVLFCHSDADRAVWHRAMATPGPDEEIADELEASARRSQSRGGHASAVTALERAALLSSSDASRSRRLTAAVEAAWFAGQADLARDLVDRALDGAYTGAARVAVVPARSGPTRLSNV